MRCDGSLHAVVAGGASGLGAGTVAALSALGVSLSVIDLPERAVAPRPDGVRFVGADVADPEAVAAAVVRVEAEGGIPRVLVNCAGIAPAARSVSREGPHDPALFARVLAVNLTGSFQLASAFAARMATLEPLGEDAERGLIVNTASVAAFDGQVGQCAYAASKAGVVGLTLPMARDLASLGIRVCAIAPGIFETPMVTAMPEEVQASLAAQIPFPKRLGRPADYAALVRQIVENPMLNGEVMRLDGAIRMGAR